MQFSDTIAAIATPPGEGGIAVLRISGREALAIAASVFTPQRRGDIVQFPGYSVHYGRFVEASGETADDGLLTVFRAPHSYTGEETAELSCHGGRVTSARILRLVLAAGARPAEPGEFTQRAFLNGRMDLAQAEAVADLIRAQTETAQRMARRQIEGALSRAVRKLRDDLISILASIEVTIDFSDEVGDLEYAPLRERLAAVRSGVETLLATAEQGRILREGLRVALAGRPNVGKSSLFNALLRENRAIVTPLAGTTRDRLEETANIGGVPVVIMDGAGIRETNDIVEQAGVERAEQAAIQSDVLLFVLDAAEMVTQDDLAIAARIRSVEPARIIVALNKLDLLGPGPLAEALVLARQSLPAAEYVLVSAQTGQGLRELEQALLRVAAGRNAPAPRGETEPGRSAQRTDTIYSGESVLVSSARHQQALQDALVSLREAEQTAQAELPGDFVAIDARGALDSLGLITGETVTDDIIHRIFRDFCVGK